MSDARSASSVAPRGGDSNAPEEPAPRRRPGSRVAWSLAVVLLAVGAYWWFGHKPARDGAALGTSASASGAASGAGGVIAVSTQPAQRRDVDVTIEATGTVTALNSVDIRPQVSSVITQVHIKEGQFVKAGQLLFTLDSRNDEVNVTKARAQLAKDQAALADAQRQLSRSRELVAQNFISQGALDTNQALVDSQLAVVAADKAAIDSAKVGLSYNRIVAPAAGRAGAIDVYAGSTVQPGGTALVTITQLDPIAVGFNLPQRNLGDALQTLRSGGGKVLAVLPEGRGVHTGKLQFVDNSVDAGSGTVRVKAQFDNGSEALWPGAFVTVKLAINTLAGAIVVPQAAIIQAPKGNIVYVVEAGDKVAARPVEIVYSAGPDAVVTGVKAGERVVVEGRQNLRPGARVIERATADSGDAPAARSGARSASAPGAGASSGAASAGATP